MTHTLPYCYYQGRTLRGKRFMLMSCRSPHLTMRHLIMGLGRVTKGDMVSIAPPSYERTVLESARVMQLHYAVLSKPQRASGSTDAPEPEEEQSDRGDNDDDDEGFEGSVASGDSDSD